MNKGETKKRVEELLSGGPLTLKFLEKPHEITIEVIL